ncbi:MAG: TadE family protein [Planctomycetaceae bacterium]|nr:TadE family protein [Planctomycetaceae bacterium]
MLSSKNRRNNTNKLPVRNHDRKGQALVEFALVALVLYLLLGAIITFGQMIYASQGTQQAADLLARELSHASIGADLTLAQAINNDKDENGGRIETSDVNVQSTVLAKIYDPKYLVLYIGPDDGNGNLSFQGHGTLYALMSKLPLVNQQLVPLMIFDKDSFPGTPVLRYPGAIAGSGVIGPAPDYYSDGPQTIDATVTIYDSNGNTVDVVNEIILDKDHQPPNYKTPFQISSPQRGVVALQLNYPYQSAAMSSYAASPDGPFEPNGGDVQIVDDEGQAFGLYTGSKGQGRQAAWGQDVRPFSKIISATAIYRRELFE